MKVYESKDIRNVGVVGHGHSGKTSLTAGLLFSTGASNRLTRVDEGNTITDFDDEEISRKITISTSIVCVESKKNKINVLDTPGFNIFINDTRAALVAADAVLLNTAIASADDSVKMAEAMRLAVEAGRLAYEAGRMPKKLYASASSPLAGVVGR